MEQVDFCLRTEGGEVSCVLTSLERRKIQECMYLWDGEEDKQLHCPSMRYLASSSWLEKDHPRWLLAWKGRAQITETIDTAFLKMLVNVALGPCPANNNHPSGSGFEGRLQCRADRA